MKTWLGRRLFARENIRQIHIVGCSRSGTTMLHVAMSAFRNVELWPDESSANVPTLGERRDVVARFKARGIPRSTQRFLITKRNFGWFKRHISERLIEKVRMENMGLVLMFRDPRDVMLSRHKAMRPDENYVSADHWTRSILAGEHIAAQLAGHPGFMTVNYEKLVTDPESVRAEMSARYGLELRAGSPGLGAIKANVEASEGDFEDYLIDALHGVRDMDPASIGKWRAEDEDPAAPLKADPDTRIVFERYAAQHGYPVDIEL